MFLTLKNKECKKWKTFNFIYVFLILIAMRIWFKKEWNRKTLKIRLFTTLKSYNIILKYWCIIKDRILNRIVFSLFRKQV